MPVLALVARADEVIKRNVRLPKKAGNRAITCGSSAGRGPASGPEEYAVDIDREEAKWAKVVQLAKATK